MARRFNMALMAAAMGFMSFYSYAAVPQKQQIANYVIPAGPVTGPVPETIVVHLAIGLPSPDEAGLRSLADAVSDPKSSQFRHFLTLEQLTAKFSPTAADYQALINWAQSNHLTVEAQYSHRLLLGVKGQAADVERALAIKLSYAKRPDGSTFYKPDIAPSLDLDVKVSYIAGVDTLFVPHRDSGSQWSGTAYGYPDLRNAYAGACLGLTGAGQSVGIVAFAGYNPADISSYESHVGIPNTSSTCGLSTPGSVPCLNNYNNVSLSATGDYAGYSGEVTNDIEMAINMAPGLQQVMVFEGDYINSGCAAADNIIAAMLSTTTIKQFSNSVGICPSDEIPTFDMMAASGQSFFSSSGDYGTGTFANGNLTYNTYQQGKVTDVGGTVLTMRGTGGSYQSEQAWDCSGGGSDTSGSPTCTTGCTPGTAGCSGGCIPQWQKGIANAQNGASPTLRNYPDLAMVADSVYDFDIGLQGITAGTSLSSPLMAGFMALANEQQCTNSPSSCASGAGGLGFINPVIYSVGFDPGTFASSFNDIIGTALPASCTGGNLSAPAVKGYDMATGWGSPTCGLISQLSCTTCTGATAHPGTPPSSSCVSFQSDSNNCGTCGNVCSSGLSCVKGSCEVSGSMGDTHLTTFDGLYYDFQASGDFILAETSPEFVVQTRQASGAPRWPLAAVNKEVAVGMGKTHIALCLDESTPLHVDGKPNQLGDGKSLSLLDGVDVSRSGNTYVITRRGGETVQAVLNATWIDVTIGLGHWMHGPVHGLLGNANGNTADDITTRNGTLLSQPVSFADLYRSYGESWQVPRGESLLCGDKKAEYIMPEKPFYARDLAPLEYQRARATCTAAGVKNDALLDACTLDTTVLNDKAATRIFTITPRPIAVMQLNTLHTP